MKGRLIKKLRKSRAFTLIELIAVILVLGVIALIAVPTVTRIVDTSKRNSAKISTENYVRAVEQHITLLEMDGEGIEAGTYTVSELEDLGIVTDGSKPKKGTVTIDEKGKVSSLNVTLNGYNVSYDGDTYLVSDIGEEEPAFVFKDGTPIYYNPVTGSVCSNYTINNSTTGTISGCLKWYIFGDASDNTTLDLLLDHNIDDSYEWGTESGNPTGILEMLSRLSSWNSKLTRNDSYTFNNKSINYTGYKARILSMEDLNKIFGEDLSRYRDTDNDGIIYEFNHPNLDDFLKLTYGKVYVSKYGWLFDNLYRCKDKGCFNQIDSLDEGYWLPDFYSSDEAYILYTNGLSMYYVEDGDMSGVRPVITINKGEALKASYYVDGTPVYYNPVTNSKCTDYTGNNSNADYVDGCMKWFAYNDTVGASTVNLLLDHNILNRVRAQGFFSIEGYLLPNTTSNWTITPRLLTLEETLLILKYDELFYHDEIETFSVRFSSYNVDNVDWLTSNMDGCSECTNESTGFYLGESAYNTDRDCGTWAISSFELGGDGICVSDGSYGIRPVITINK